MKKGLIFTLVFLGILAVSCAQAKDRDAAIKDALTKTPVAKKGSPAPDFKLQDIYQDVYTLSDYKGEKPVLLFFWTTWCPFCQKELTILNDMYAGLVKDGLEVFSIDVGEDPAKVQDYVKNYYLAYRVLLDKDAAVSRAYELLGVPTYVLVDKDSNIIFKDNYFPQKEYKDLIEQ